MLKKSNKNNKAKNNISCCIVSCEYNGKGNICLASLVNKKTNSDEKSQETEVDFTL